MHRHPRLAVVVLAATLALTGCLPAPTDIGLDYSGPILRKPGADEPRVVTGAPVLPVAETAGCSPLIESPSRKRSACGVRLIMEKNNPGLQAMYQQHLANEPMLKGTMILRLAIAPAGNVTAVDIASTTIRYPNFIRDVQVYVRAIRFGALEGVPPWADTYTVEFTPPQDTIPDKPDGPQIVPGGGAK